MTQGLQEPLIDTRASPRLDIGALIQGSKVHGSVYTDPAIYEQELRRSGTGCGSTWAMSAKCQAHDFVMKSIGPEPVLMTRDATARST
jgi:hypothetical protein